jgi:hypothetical protein
MLGSGCTGDTKEPATLIGSITSFPSVGSGLSRSIASPWEGRHDGRIDTRFPRNGIDKYALGLFGDLYHLHGDDRQPAIRLDAVRQSDQQST